MPAHSAPPLLGAGGALLLLVLLFLFASTAYAQPPKTLVILTSNLTWDDMRANGDLLPLRRLASEGGAALLNATVSGESTEAAAFLTVGAGDRITAPGENGPRIPVDEVPLSISDIAAEAYPANAWEGNAVRPVYFRRFGVAPPANAIGVDIGLPTLQRVQPGASQANMPGALGDALTKAGRRVAVFGDWRAVVVGMDRQGVAYHGSAVLPLSPEGIPNALEEADIIVVAAEAGLRPLRLLAKAALPLVHNGTLNLIVACPSPPVDSKAGRWTRLGFIVAAGPGFPQHSLLTSATTRTPGLVANIDLAPTILALQGLPAFSGGTGHAISSLPEASGANLDSITRLDERVNATESATVPVLAGYAALAIVGGLAGIIGLFAAGKYRNVPGGRISAFTLRLAAAGPLAFLAAGVIPSEHVWQYGAIFAGCALILVLLTDLLGSWLNLSALGLLFIATVIFVCLDALLGSHLVSQSLLSGYSLPGLRFYGVGNEYMTLTIGAALAGTALLIPGADLAVGGLLAIVLGLPWFGANAGGALVAAMVTLLAVFARRSGRLRSGHIAFSFAIALVLAILLAATDTLLPTGARTHLGDAASLLSPNPGQNGLSALAEIAARKMVRGAHVSKAGWTLAALAGIAPIVVMFASGTLRERTERVLLRAPALEHALPAALWGAIAVALFTDSGIAAALVLLAPLAAAIIHEMLDN